MGVIGTVSARNGWIYVLRVGSLAGKIMSGVALLLTLTLVVSSCSLFAGNKNSGLGDVLDKYAKALAKKDIQVAAGLTTAPEQAQEYWTQTLTKVRPESVTVSILHKVEFSNGDGAFRLKTTWDLGKGRSWATETSGEANKLSVGWRLRWSPTLLHSSLGGGGALLQKRTDAKSPKILGAGNQPVMTGVVIYDVILDPRIPKSLPRSISQLVTAIAPIAPLVTAKEINAALKNSNNSPITVVSFREADYRALPNSPKSVPGVTVQRSVRLLLSDRRSVTPLLPGISDFWQAIRDATSGWEILLVKPGSTERLAGEQGRGAGNIKTSLNTRTQLAAGDAVVQVGQPAIMLVADSKTGAITAAAKNELAETAGISLTARYPVGSSLDAVWRAVGVAQQPRTEVINRLGLDSAFVIPGIRSTGEAEIPQSLNSDAPEVNTINMLTFALGIARGNSVAPKVFIGQESKAVAPLDGQSKTTDSPLGTINSLVREQIRTAMTKIVATGDASDLSGKDGLLALVGTNGPQGPGWFVGVRDGQVFVIFCAGASSGIAALQVAQRFLMPAAVE